jgi:signal peptidase I
MEARGAAECFGAQRLGDLRAAREGVFMTDRTLFLLLCAVVAVLTGIYFLNPLRTATNDPRMRLFGFTVYLYPSRSMDPTMRENQLLIVSAWPYVNKDPRPGDVIVFKSPELPTADYAQRIAAAGGSTIEIKDGTVFVDGKPVQEPYVAPDNAQKKYSRVMAPIRVPAGQFFILGDNRDISSDSRIWGFLPRGAVIGRVN